MSDYSLFETMGTALDPTGVTFTHSVRTDGIEINYFDGRSMVIPHSEFRPWSFNAGYWSGAYYEFVENLDQKIIEKFLNEKKG